jgi:hypothetical protein
MSGPEGLETFLVLAWEEQHRIDCLLACDRRFLVLPDNRCVREARVARWTKDLTDPELKKNLRILHGLISDAVGICERRRLRADPDSVDPRKDVLARLEQLKALATLPGDAPLTLKLVLAHRFELERFLVEVGDEDFLRGRSADYLGEGEGTMVAWAGLAREGLFPAIPPLLEHLGPPYDPGAQDEPPGVDAQAVGTETPPQLDDVERTRRLLTMLIAAKNEQDLPLRARRELKRQVLWAVLPVIVVTTILFGLAIGLVDDEADAFLVAAAAGAAGASLGGLFRLRDEVSLGARIREFFLFYVGQVVVGAAAGLLVYVVARAGIVTVGEGTNGIAAFSFAAGFSEAVFLGLVDRMSETFLGQRKGAEGEEA